MIAAQRLRTAGSVLLATGLLAALIIYGLARPIEDPGILGVDVPTKRDNLQLERMGGKSYVLFNDLDQWFASLWHGRRLAYSVGIIAIAGFLGCRWFADRLADPRSSDERRRD